MKDEKFQNLLQYHTILAWVHSLLTDGTITKAEYAKIDTRMARKYGISSSSIFVDFMPI